MTMLLPVGSGIALILLMVHSWRVRGRRVTLGFFGAGLVFGLVRANVVWLIVSHLEGNPEAMKPYLPQGGFLPEIGHASIQVAMGWVFALYLAWTISELILRRLPPLADRVFVIVGLSCVFMAGICYCMETTAVASGWWYWNLPTRTALFGNVNLEGMWAWFSVAHDFLLPFLVIVCSTSRSPLRWLWLLAFPLHMLSHLAYNRVPFANLNHHAMVLLVLLMLLSKLKIVRGRANEPSSGTSRVVQALPAAALVIFFGVIATANLATWGGPADVPANLLTLLPLMLFCLLAWWRLPICVVGVLSVTAVTGWAWAGPRALYALAPVAAYLFLDVLRRLREPIALRIAPVAVMVALSAWVLIADEQDADRSVLYREAWAQGDRLEIAGEHDAALLAYARADALRPHDTLNFFNAINDMMRGEGTDRGKDARVFEFRIPRFIDELEELVRRDPEWQPPRKRLVRLYLIRGRLSDAIAQYRRMLAYRPKDADLALTLARLLNDHAAHSRTLETTEKHALLLEAMQLDPRNVRARFNLARTYLSPGPSLRDPVLALRHARRATTFARAQDDRDLLAESLLVLGLALAENGKREEARGAAEEGRSMANEGLRPAFNVLMRRIEELPR